MYRLTRVPAWSQHVEYVSMDFVHVLLPLSAKGRPSAQETTPSNGAGNKPKNLSVSLSVSLYSLARSTITDRAGCTHVHVKLYLSLLFCHFSRASLLHSWRYRL